MYLEVVVMHLITRLHPDGYLIMYDVIEMTTRMGVDDLEVHMNYALGYICLHYRYTVMHA